MLFFFQVEFVYSKCFPAAKYCMSLACQSICYFLLFAPHFWENERCRQSILENHKGQWHQVVDTQTGFWLWDETRFCFLLLSQHVQDHSASSFCSPGCKQRAKYTVCWKCMNKLIDCARLGWQKRIWKWTHWIHLLLLLHQCSLRWFRTRHQLKQHSVRRSALLSTCLTAPTVYVVSRCGFVSTLRPKILPSRRRQTKKNPKQIRKTDQKLNAFGFATQQNADNHQCERALTNLGEGNQEHVYRRGKTPAANWQSAEKSERLVETLSVSRWGAEKNKNLFSSQPSGSAHLTFPRRPDTKPYDVSAGSSSTCPAMDVKKHRTKKTQRRCQTFRPSEKLTRLQLIAPSSTCTTRIFFLSCFFKRSRGLCFWN